MNPSTGPLPPTQDYLKPGILLWSWRKESTVGPIHLKLLISKRKGPGRSQHVETVKKRHHIVRWMGDFASAVERLAQGAAHLQKSLSTYSWIFLHWHNQNIRYSFFHAAVFSGLFASCPRHEEVEIHILRLLDYWYDSQRTVLFEKKSKTGDGNLGHIVGHRSADWRSAIPMSTLNYHGKLVFLSWNNEETLKSNLSCTLNANGASWGSGAKHLTNYR